MWTCILSKLTLRDKQFILVATAHHVVWNAVKSSEIREIVSYCRSLRVMETANQLLGKGFTPELTTTIFRDITFTKTTTTQSSTDRWVPVLPVPGILCCTENVTICPKLRTSFQQVKKEKEILHFAACWPYYRSVLVSGWKKERVVIQIDMKRTYRWYTVCSFFASTEVRNACTSNFLVSKLSNVCGWLWSSAAPWAMASCENSMGMQHCQCVCHSLFCLIVSFPHVSSFVLEALFEVKRILDPALTSCQVPSSTIFGPWNPMMFQAFRTWVSTDMRSYET